MKNILPEYFEPSEADIKEVWNNGTIVLDANVLLNLFRYTKTSREELIKIIKHYKDRLWLPYQIAYEFLENSAGVPASLNKVLNDTLKSIDSIYGLIESQLKLNDYDKYHMLKPTELRGEIKKFQETLHNRVDRIKDEYSSVNKKNIVEQVAEIFEGRVGEDYSKDKLEQLFKEGEKRYKEKVPPGYKDLDDKKGASQRHLYGDLIWWKQTIDYAKAHHCNMIVVTDDAKEDWWYKVNNETRGPRVELIREFSQQTDGQSFHLYRTSRFIEYAKKYDKVTISAKSIKEIKETSPISFESLVTEPRLNDIIEKLSPSTGSLLYNIPTSSVEAATRELVSPSVTSYIKALEDLNKKLSNFKSLVDFQEQYRKHSITDGLAIGPSDDNDTDTILP